MQEGVITEDSGFPCDKSMVGCHNHPSARNVAEAVQYSCNPYYYAVVRRIIQQGKKKDYLLMPNTDSISGTDT